MHFYSGSVQSLGVLESPYKKPLSKAFEVLNKSVNSTWKCDWWSYKDGVGVLMAVSRTHNCSIHVPVAISSTNVFLVLQLL